MRRPCEASLRLNATSRSGTRRLELLLAAPPATFGDPIPVPTPNGFSAVPGCRESMRAAAHLTAWARADRASPFEVRLRLDIPLAVLEFGGTHQCGQRQGDG